MNLSHGQFYQNMLGSREYADIYQDLLAMEWILLQRMQF